MTSIAIDADWLSVTGRRTARWGRPSVNADAKDRFDGSSTDNALLAEQEEGDRWFRDAALRVKQAGSVDATDVGDEDFWFIMPPKLRYETTGRIVAVKRATLRLDADECVTD